MTVMTEDQRVEIGSRFNGERLVQASEMLQAKATADGLTFPDGFMDRVGANTESVETLRKDQAVAKDDVPTSTAAQAEAFADLKDWVSDVIEATDNAFEDDPEERERFHRLGAKIGRSVPRLLDRASTLLPLLTDPAVAPVIAEWDFDAARVAEGEGLIDALRAADTAQEVAKRVLPGKTRDYYLAKGNLYLDLKRIARRGRRRFADDPSRSAAYVLDLVPRRKSRKAATTTTTQS